jgi:hypothetical protein
LTGSATGSAIGADGETVGPAGQRKWVRSREQLPQAKHRGCTPGSGIVFGQVHPGQIMTLMSTSVVCIAATGKA